VDALTGDFSMNMKTNQQLPEDLDAEIDTMIKAHAHYGHGGAGIARCTSFDVQELDMLKRDFKALIATRVAEARIDEVKQFPELEIYIAKNGEHMEATRRHFIENTMIHKRDRLVELTNKNGEGRDG
jgi:hypothetical protein